MCRSRTRRARVCTRSRRSRGSCSTRTAGQGATATAMVDFMKWALTDGQKFAPALGYAPLPDRSSRWSSSSSVGSRSSEAAHEGSKRSDSVPSGHRASSGARAGHRGRDRRRADPRSRSLSIEKFGFEFWLTDIWDPVARRVRRAAVHLGHALLVGTRAAHRDADLARHRDLTCPSCVRPALRQPLIFLTELLAAIPSIVYGLWGIFVLVPLVRELENALP